MDAPSDRRTLAAAALATLLLAGCFVGGSGAGSKGGKGTGGGASGTVMIGGTQHNTAINVLAPEQAPCRKQLDQLGIPYDQRSFIAQIQNNNAPAVRAFLTCGMELETRDPDRGLTALAWAAHSGAADIATLLLDKGADVQGRSRRSTAPTPLMAAVDTNHTEIALALVARGADVTIAVGDDSALALAAERGNVGLLKALLAAGADVKGPQGGAGLRRAAAAGQLEAARTLVAAGADVDAPDDAGDTPLIHAARKEQVALGCFLLAAGADPHRVNKVGSDAFEDTGMSAAAFVRDYCQP